MKKAIFIILALCILGGIFWFSSKNHESSYKQSDTLLLKFGLLSEDELENDIEKTYRMRIIIRKSAHFILYFTFSLIALIVIYQFKSGYVRSMKLAFLLVILIANLDEYYQRFSPGRTSRIEDVIFDIYSGVIGIIVASIGIYLVSKFKNRHKGLRDDKTA